MSGEDVVIIDVREPAEYESDHADDAINLPLSRLMQGERPDNLPKDRKLVVYCNSGNRSDIAMKILKAAGYENVENGINQDEISRDYT